MENPATQMRSLPAATGGPTWDLRRRINHRSVELNLLTRVHHRSNTVVAPRTVRSAEHHALSDKPSEQYTYL